MNMHVSPDGIERLHQRESCRLVAYLDSAGVPTIGWGTTRYPSGERVKLGETCTQAQADAWFVRDLQRFELAVDALTTDLLLERQFDALTSFTYNEGEGNYRASTLRKMVNANPQDPGIRTQFMRWYYVTIQTPDGPIHKPVKGLWIRRHSEADQYDGVVTSCPPYPHKIEEN